MTCALIARLARLESRVTSAECGVTVRFGHLKRLPPQYTGERHVIVARELPKQSDQDWGEFEEVPGPEPEAPQIIGRGARHPIAIRLDVMFVNNGGQEAAVA
jgi:hypothetical protein